MAPTIITKEEKRYFEYVEIDDYKGFNDFLRAFSLEETNVIQNLYNQKEENVSKQK